MWSLYDEAFLNLSTVVRTIIFIIRGVCYLLTITREVVHNRLCCFRSTMASRRRLVWVSTANRWVLNVIVEYIFRVRFNAVNPKYVWIYAERSHPPVHQQSVLTCSDLVQFPQVVPLRVINQAVLDLSPFLLFPCFFLCSSYCDRSIEWPARAALTLPDSQRVSP